MKIDEHVLDVEAAISEVENFRVIFVRGVPAFTCYPYKEAAKTSYEVGQRIMDSLGTGYPFMVIDCMGRVENWRGIR